VTGPADILNSMDVTTASKLARPDQNRKLTISELPPPKFHLPGSSVQASQELGSRWLPVPLGRRSCLLRRASRKVRVLRQETLGWIGRLGQPRCWDVPLDRLVQVRDRG